VNTIAVAELDLLRHKQRKRCVMDMADAVQSLETKILKSAQEIETVTPNLLKCLEVKIAH
jgi:hypothetical protein